MAKESKKVKRFKQVYSQLSGMGSSKVIVDTETGVNYFFYDVGFSGGLTVLLDKDGKPVITDINKE